MVPLESQGTTTTGVGQHTPAASSQIWDSAGISPFHAAGVARRRPAL